MLGRHRVMLPVLCFAMRGTPSKNLFGVDCMHLAGSTALVASGRRASAPVNVVGWVTTLATQGGRAS